MLEIGGVVMDHTANMYCPLFLPITRAEGTKAVIRGWCARGGIEPTLVWGEYAFAMPDDHPQGV